MRGPLINDASRHRVLTYLPALDGLRAVAVLAVLLYHGEVSWARGGYFGVDAFFVLSGFLITSLLLGEWRATGRIGLGAFWARRARRLLPALALVLAAVALYAHRYAPAPEVNQLRRDGLTSLFYVANWGQIFSDTSYFEQFAPSSLRHTWSLAIEEQFYLVWPLLVLGVLRLRRGSRRALLGTTVALAAGSAVLMALLYRPGHDPSRVYYGTDTRGQSLLMGAILAILLIDRPAFLTRHRRPVQWLAIGAAVVLAVVWGTTSFSADWQYRGGFAAMAALVCVVIASVTDPHDTGPLGALLSLPFLRAIGIISYGVYLWHWPIYVYLSADRTGLEGTKLLALRLAVTFTIATISYLLIEAPIRHGWLRRPAVRIITPIVAVTLAAALLTSTAGDDTARFRSIPAADIAGPAVEPLTRDAAVGPMRVMLVGDSVASSMAPGLAKQAEARGFSFWDVAVPGCGLSDVGDLWINRWVAPDPHCKPPWRERWKSQVDRFRPDVVVMLVGARDTFDRRINTEVYKFDGSEGANLARSDLSEAIEVLTARGAHLIILTTPYYTRGWPIGIPEARINRYNALQREVASASRDKASILDLNRLLDPNGRYTDTVNGVKVRIFDRVHLSDEGADLVANWLAPNLRAYAKRLARKPETVDEIG